MIRNTALIGIFFALFAALGPQSSVVASQSTGNARGSYLRATIDGKPWVASEVVPDKYWSEILQIQGRQGTTSLWVQLKQPTAANVAEPLKGTDLNYYQDETFNMFMVTSGEIRVTKLDAEWVEGTFTFSGTDKRAKKSVTVTNGAFRVPRPKK